MFVEEKSCGEAPARTTPVLHEEWRKRLWEGAQRIRHNGFNKKGFISKDGRYCALGAIYNVQIEGAGTRFDTKPYMHAADIAFQEYLGQRLGYPANTPVWNDAPERTAEEVIAALEDCAVHFVP